MQENVQSHQEQLQNSCKIPGNCPSPRLCRNVWRTLRNDYCDAHFTGNLTHSYFEFSRDRKIAPINRLFFAPILHYTFLFYFSGFWIPLKLILLSLEKKESRGTQNRQEGERSDRRWVVEGRQISFAMGIESFSTEACSPFR